jgi:hypothetical protein
MATKKKSVVLPRRVKTGVAAAPIDSFRDFKQYIHAECEKKEISQVVKSYLKDTLNKKDSEFILKNTPEYEFTSASWLASSVLWQQKELPLPTNWNFDTAFDNYIEDLKYKAQHAVKMASFVKKDDTPTVERKTPMEIIQEKAAEFIGDIEGIVDDYLNGDIKEYSLFDTLKRTEASAQQARLVAERYKKVRAEIDELCNLPPVSKQSDFQKQLAEGYSFLKKTEQKAYLKFLDNLIDDVDKYIGAKKAVRKPRVAKPKAADKQVAKIQYMKQCPDYKLASIAPINIIGAMRLYLFNTKTRVITELISNAANGFEVKGTTVLGIDMENSRSVKLRKPEDFIKIVMSKTPRQINKAWDELTTKSTEANGRINKDMIIMRVTDR